MVADLIPFAAPAGKGEALNRPAGAASAAETKNTQPEARGRAQSVVDPLPPSTFSPEVAKTLDRLFNAHIANFTAGTDPRVIPLAFLDWWVKLVWSPGTHARLTEKAARKAVRMAL